MSTLSHREFYSVLIQKQLYKVVQCSRNIRRSAHKIYVMYAKAHVYNKIVKDYCLDTLQIAYKLILW